MTIVFITDIEGLVKAKMEIDELLITNKEIEEKSKLEDFVNKYGKLKDVFFDCGKIIPFNYVDIHGHKYIFLADETDNIEHLTSILENINYNASLLKQTSDIEIIKKFGDIENAQYFFINGKTYIEP